MAVEIGTGSLVKARNFTHDYDELIGDMMKVVQNYIQQVQLQTW